MDVRCSTPTGTLGLNFFIKRNDYDNGSIRSKSVETRGAPPTAFDKSHIKETKMKMLAWQHRP
jgi:hypothetical protein